MSLAVERADFFNADYATQFEWYVQKAGDEVAWRFQTALNTTLQRLAECPELGRVRHFRDSRLRGLRLCQVDQPFHKLLIFYRLNGDRLEAVRLMHSARDLGRRLVEPPNSF